MNYDVTKENLSVRRLDFEGCQEVPIDMDFSLPDYCPDIQRILKCRVCPGITSRNISGDRLNIEGNVDICLIYLDADNMHVRCCKNAFPFSSSIDIKSAPENAISLTSVRAEYINCRAVTPRKIDVHGAFSICAKIFSKCDTEITSSVSGKDIEQKVKKIKAESLAGIGQQQFSINEVLEFSDEVPAPEILVRSDVSVTINDYKIMPNKIVAKGKACIKLLYISDITSGALQTYEQCIPISQIVDVPGVNEDFHYVITPEVLSHEEQIQSDEGSSINRVATDIKIAITVMAYEDKDVNLVSDIYSTMYDIETENESVKLIKLLKIINDSVNHSDSIEFQGMNISEIVDIWSDVCSVKFSSGVSEDGFLIKMNLCMIAIDSENIPFYVERILEFNYVPDIPEKVENIIFELSVVPESIDYDIVNKNNVNLKLNLNVYGAAYTIQKNSMITSAKTDEEIPSNKDTSASLTIYYASQGESLWDIARKYYTSVNSIKKENDLSESVVKESGMLLIPMK